MRPTRRLLALAALAVAVALLPALVHPGLWPLWATVAVVVVVAPVVDALRAAAPRRLAAVVRPPGTLHVGREATVELRVRASGGAPVDAVEARLELDGEITPVVAATVALVDGRGRVRLGVRARRRGRVRVAELWLRWRGPWALVTRQVRRPLALEVDVLPDLAWVRDAALRFAASTEMLTGLHERNRTGDGSEFDSIREFVPGLDPRALHWKASARHRKLLVREFRAERDHQVVLAVDCGRLMGEPLGALPRLDHAINAGLLLAWFGLRYGDRVGLYGFDARPRHFVAPRAGVRHFPRLLAGTGELDYGAHETNFTLALAHLSTRLRHRALVVVFTDFVDAITAELMVDNLARLARHHLVLFVALRDPGLDRLAGDAPRALDDVARAVLATDLLRERELVIRRLQRAGVLTLDVAPEDLSAGLIDRYLEVKKRELIA